MGRKKLTLMENKKDRRKTEMTGRVVYHLFSGVRQPDSYIL